VQKRTFFHTTDLAGRKNSQLFSSGTQSTECVKCN